MHSLPPGTYPIVVEGGIDNNYEFSYQNGTLTILQAVQLPIPLIIFEIPAGVVYGDTITLSGISDNTVTPIVYTSSDESIAEISGNQLIAKGAGAVTITASQAAGNGYSAGEKSIDVTIGKKTLTVIADDKTRYEDEANPEFTVTYSGFVSGDDASVLDTRPQTYCSATQTSPPGKYPIFVGDGADNNYQFNYQYGTLTILQGTASGLSGAGTQQDPYRIATAENLDAVRIYNGTAYTGKYFLLVNDIDLTAFLTGKSEGWLPIGDDAKPFAGHFNGNGHAIKGLKIDRTGTTQEMYVGLFGYNTGTIDGLGVSGGNVAGSANNSDCGGLAGYNAGTVTNCYATVNVSAYASVSSSSCGGLIGLNAGAVTNCYATGLAAAEASMSSSSGGLIGRNQGTVTNCYSIGMSAANGPLIYSAGAVIGYNEAGASNISLCYYNKDVAGSMLSVGNFSGSANALGLTTVDMKKRSSFAGWDFDKVWGINEGNSYPYLRLFPQGVAGINHPESLAAQVYPNPAKNDLFIQSDFPIERVELYSSTGVLVKVETGVTEKIDISPLTEGIYFVRIYSGNQMVVRRVVVKN